MISCWPLAIFYNLYKALIRGLYQSISLGLIWGRVDQYNSKLLTKLDQWFSLEGCNIISDDFVQTTKPYYNILQKTNDPLMRSTPCGDNLYPLGKIICGS